MEAFTTHTGLVALLDRLNVDTDQIIPKQYLKTIHRTGLKETISVVALHGNMRLGPFWIMGFDV